MRAPQQLPGPNADVWDWQLLASCRGEDWTLFFAADCETRRRRAQREQRAKQMCRGCPVRTECRTHALTIGEAYGVWGGLSEPERTRLIDTESAAADRPH
ncbi:WhiB family transcriptional regulator [Mycolicibacterium sp. CBMA 234]|uniref:WhiB family transcriptional regulator n=1 Tax=Mycolicibacterium sp. CBMA 234 TaxID=1918495 RepID=UPI0012DCBEA8|nr:WhiB family transcriptional regulator [Mycolicibacterium sp. CBMA 234]